MPDDRRAYEAESAVIRELVDLAADVEMPAKSGFAARGLRALRGRRIAEFSVGLDETEIALIETMAGLDLPRAYRTFLGHKHFDHLELLGVRFFPMSADSWQRGFAAEYASWMPDRILGRGLLPFAFDSLGDAGPVCFDTTPSAETPVVIWDHDWVGTDKEIRRSVFSSPGKMFECLLEAEKLKRFKTASWNECIETVMRLDPDGAGGPGRSWWTSFLD